MTTRTTQTIVRLSAPFMLPGFNAAQPAGDYRVDQDEELLEESSRLAWRRVAAFVHLPAIGIRGNSHFAFTDKNNVKIADLLSDWLRRKRLDKEKGR